MVKRNRKTLKESFRKGYRPTEQDFENLIDSTINILDDGLSKQADTGMGLAPLHDNEAVLSVYRQPGEEVPVWVVALDKETGDLKIGRSASEGTVPLLTLSPDGQVQIGREEAEVRLSGLLRLPGRQGSFLSGEIPADGHWHDVTDLLEGCWALEVVAGCGRRHTGKYALLAATAVHCFGKRARVRKIRSHYGSFGNKLCIRWVRKGFTAKLQLKTQFRYGDNIRIRYHISRLWDLPLMEQE